MNKILTISTMSALIFASFLVVLANPAAAVFGQPDPDQYILVTEPVFTWDTDADPGSGTNMFAFDDSEECFVPQTDFTLYDQTYTGGTYTMTASANGWAKFGEDPFFGTGTSTFNYNHFDCESFMSFSNLQINAQPTSNSDYALMPLWDDWNPSSGFGSEVYTYTDATKTIVTWWQLPHWFSTGSVTFQLVYYATGDFCYSYLDMDGINQIPSFANSPTIGIAGLNNRGTNFLFSTGFGTPQGDYDAIPTTGTTLCGALAPERTCQLTEDFESGLNGWTIANLGALTNLWHRTNDFRGIDTDSEGNPINQHLYFGSDVTHNFNFGVVGGIVTSPVYVVANTGARIQFENWARTEGGTFFDGKDVLASVNGGPFVLLTEVTSPQGIGFFPPDVWDQVSVNVPANTGDTLQMRFLFNSLDSVANTGEGWRIDNVCLSIHQLPPTELIAFDGFVYDCQIGSLPAGAISMGGISVVNIGPNEAFGVTVELNSVDLATDIQLTGPESNLLVGEIASAEWIMVVAAGTPDGGTLEAAFDVNAGNAPAVQEVADIGIQWKNSGNDQSSYRHCQNTVREIWNAHLNVESGEADASEEATVLDAADAFLDDDWARAKKLALSVDGPGLGANGLAPGQVEGNEGNGNGGLKGNE
jgi:hypothetical protein